MEMKWHPIVNGELNGIPQLGITHIPAIQA